MAGFAPKALRWLGIIGSGNSSRNNLDLEEFQSCRMGESVTKNRFNGEFEGALRPSKERSRVMAFTATF